MPADKTDGPQRDAEAEIWNAIAAFEKILEAIPDDRSSLETLSHAYEHIGDQSKTLEYLLRLGDVIVRECDTESAGYLREKLEAFGSSDEEVLRVCSSLMQLQSEADKATPVVEVASPSAVVGQSAPAFRVADELAFAWRLFEAGELTQEEYAGVAQDLSEMSTAGHLSTVSVLHVLENRAYSGMERLMGGLARDAGTPIVSLQSFEIPSNVQSLLPLEFVVRRGVLVFDLIADDALVVVMNPYDKALREHVAAQLGRMCHFFITSPLAFDDAVTRIREASE